MARPDRSAWVAPAGEDAISLTLRRVRLPAFLLAAAIFGLVMIARSACAEEIAVKGGIIDLQWTSTPNPAQLGVVRQWIQNSALAVVSFHGAFPMRRTVLRITPTKGRKMEDGHASGWQGAVLTLSLGREATAADLADDWLLTHEMFHLAFPDLDERHHWLEEGLSTYLEPLARARAGLLTPARAWNDLYEGLPQGQPEAGDRGLDRTHTWGRTYWGGALFCLRADVEIHRRTDNRRGLEHALRAIVAAGGVLTDSWSIDRVISVGDRATGTGVLRELYDEMKATPVRVDLPALWKQLGVVRRPGTVAFDDTAPLAATRRAIIGG